MSRSEKQALNKWTRNMNNTDNEFLLRIQDKGNRFIFVDKETDKKRQMSRLERVILKKFVLIQLHYIFKK